MITDIERTVELAGRSLPPETLFAAMQATQRLEDEEDADLGCVSLGNMTGCDIVLMPLLERLDDQVLVSIIGWSAYPFALNGSLLHWTYVAEKLVPGHNPCDAVALTLLLGVVLRRGVAVSGACDCKVHRDL